MQQSKTKRFFKRIERFIVSCKQYVIVRHLLFSGGKEVIANYKHFSLENSEQITDAVSYTHLTLPTNREV